MPGVVVERRAPVKIGAIIQSDLFQRYTPRPRHYTYTTKSRPQLTDVFYEGMISGRSSPHHLSHYRVISLSGDVHCGSAALYRCCGRIAHAIYIATEAAYHGRLYDWGVGSREETEMRGFGCGMDRELSVHSAIVAATKRPLGCVARSSQQTLTSCADKTRNAIVSRSGSFHRLW